MDKFKVKAVLAGWLLILLAAVTFGQKADEIKSTPAGAALPKVTQIDAIGLQKLLKPNGKPILINFWATWCDPCREEFPDLVKLDADYKGKIDFITISLDDLEEINTGVPKFLASMKAEMPAYLLKTPDEGAAIAMVTKDWQGGLPFTILLDEKGSTVYFRQGKIKPETVREKIDALIRADTPVTNVVYVDLPILKQNIYSFEKGVAAAKTDFAAENYQILRYGLTPGGIADTSKPQGKIRLIVKEHGCMVYAGFPEYAAAYNATMKSLLINKFGAAAVKKTGI